MVDFVFFEREKLMKNRLEAEQAAAKRRENAALKAERKKRAEILESEGEKESYINIASGRKEAIILEAEGEAAAILAKAEATAAALQRVERLRLNLAAGCMEKANSIAVVHVGLLPLARVQGGVQKCVCTHCGCLYLPGADLAS